MHPLLAVTLFWTVLIATTALLGYASIKYGVYTAGNSQSKSYLEV